MSSRWRDGELEMASRWPERRGEARRGEARRGEETAQIAGEDGRGEQARRGEARRERPAHHCCVTGHEHRQPSQGTHTSERGWASHGTIVGRGAFFCVASSPSSQRAKKGSA